MSAIVIQLNPSRSDAEKIIKDIAADSSRVILSNHARKQMRIRQITPKQVLRCLEMGGVTEGPWKDNMTGDWRCTVRRFAAGQEVQVAVAFSTKERLIVVTAM